MKSLRIRFLLPACLLWAGCSRILGADPVPLEGVGVSVGTGEVTAQEILNLEKAGGNGEPSIHYSAQAGASGALTILPQFKFVSPTGIQKTAEQDYLALLRDGGPIWSFEQGMGPMANVSFPLLDFKVVNNSGASLYFTNAVINVASSKVEAEPLPLLFGGLGWMQSFSIYNDGWSPVSSLALDFNLVAQPPASDTATLPAGQSYAFSRKIGPFTSSVEVDLSQELISAGLPRDLVENNGRYVENGKKLSSLSTDPASEASYQAIAQQSSTLAAEVAAELKQRGLPKIYYASGRITYTWTDDAKVRSKTVAFFAPVRLAPPSMSDSGGGGGTVITGKYQVMLQAQGAGYSLKVPLSQSVAAGGLTRFTLALGVPCTSEHQFTVDLETSDGRLVPAATVTLHGFLPKSAASSLENATPSP